MNSALATKIEANRKEFERLLRDSDYIDVRFNPENGALAAVHKEHYFDKTIGRFEIPRGDYERISLEVLYKNGHKIIMMPENKETGIKSPEGFLDENKFDIKGVEGLGNRNIVDKISDAGRQGAKTIVLYFHNDELFDLNKILNAYKGYKKLTPSMTVQNVYYIVNGNLYSI